MQTQISACPLPLRRLDQRSIKVRQWFLRDHMDKSHPNPIGQDPQHARRKVDEPGKTQNLQPEQELAIHKFLNEREYFIVKCGFHKVACPQPARIKELGGYTLLDLGSEIRHIDIPNVGGLQVADVESEVSPHRT